MAKKIHSKDNFELCYLRHQYLRKANVNPTRAEVAPYSQVVNSQAGKTYTTYKKLFYAVGFDFSDIIKICDAHLISFLGLFHIQAQPEKYQRFVEAFVERNQIMPSDNDIIDKNKANLTCFLKQRMEELVRICRQKVKNVRGVPMQEFHIFAGPREIEIKNEELVANFSKYGYKKVDLAIFRSIKKKAKPENPLYFSHEGLFYISIPTDYKPLELLDFSNAGLDPRDTMHNRNPEEVVIMSESTNKWNREYKKFKKIPTNRKTDMLKLFIETNKNSPLFAEELVTAKKILARLEN